MLRNAALWALMCTLGGTVATATVSGAQFPGNVQRQPLSETPNGCRAETMYRSILHESLNLQRPPRRVMWDRATFLKQAVDGYQMTHVPLVAWNGEALTPAAPTDDQGVYIFIPPIVRFFGLESQRSITPFLEAILSLGCLLGVIGFAALFQDWPSRIVAWAGIVLLALVSLRMTGDVYLVQTSIIEGTVPWCLYFARRGWSSKGLGPALFIIGLAAGTADLIRSHSGTAVLIFMAWLLMFCFWPHRLRKAVLLLVLFAGFLAPRLYLHSLVVWRDGYLAAREHGLVATQGSHPFWHPVYLGFAFLSNRYVPAYLDEVAVEKVCSVSPTVAYASSQYDAILRGQVFSLVREHPGFAAMTVAAKMGVILFLIILFANFGLWAAWKFPKSWPIETSFWLVMAFESLQGILVLPDPTYLLGSIAFATVYGVVSLGNAIEFGALRHGFALCQANWPTRSQAPFSSHQTR